MAGCARIGWLHGTCFVVVVVLASACGRVGPAPATLTVDAGSDRIVLVGQSVPLVAVVGGDVDVSEVAYAWSVVARPASSDAAIEAPTAATATFVPDAAGDFVLEVRAVATGRAGSDRTTVRAVERGVRLEGDRGARALDAAFDLSLPMVVDPAEVSVLDDHDDGVFVTLVVRTEIEIGFALDATVGQVNDLLVAYDAWLVDMLPRQRQFIARIPDPGSLEALDALVARLEDEPVVVFVLPGVVGRAEDDAVWPSVLPPATSDSSKIDHHLALRMHAVWNLRSLLPPIHRMPYLVIADLFGSGPPGPGFDVLVNPNQFETSEPTEKNHGYHVLGIVTGAYDPVPGLTPDQNLVTGVASVTIPVSTLDLQQWTFKTLSRQSSGVIRRIAAILDQDPNARIVVNTSLNDRGHPWRVSAANSWVEKVRGPDRAHIAGAGFEPDFLHLTSAGNTMENPFTGQIHRWSAQDNSFWAYAALGPLGRLALSYPNLTNVHVVENRVQTRHGDVDPATGQPARPLPGCAYDGSIMGGTLSAMGTQVWSFGAAWSPNDGAYKTGTSMSTPQVAGIAIWAFALAPHLTGPELAELLRQVADDRATTTLTRGSIACNAVVPRPVVDAYDVVLAAGAAQARIALLDLDGNGSFDEVDVAGFLGAFAAGGTRRTYGRHDLNGDGRSGERERTERFDLDGDRTFGVVQRVIRDASGVERTRSFDERALNDDDVLCYYAYGPLFAGDVVARDLSIGDRCSGNPRLAIVSPVQGERYPTTVTLRGLLEPPLDQPTTGVSGYRIYWSYPTRTGTTVHVGWTASGDSLTSVRPLCPEVALSAQARQSYAPMARAQVSFQMSEGVPGPWRATLTSPAAHTVHVDATVLSAGVTLEGVALRPTCDGPETSTSGLYWLDESLTQLATGPTLHLPGSAFADGGGYRTRTLTLRHSIAAGDSEARLRVVPCSSLPGSGLIPCPESWPELRDDLIAKHLLLADLLSPEAMRDALRERLALTFGTTLPEPFPLATPQLIGSLESELPSILVALLNRLLTDTLMATSSVDFDARLAEFASDERLSALTSDEHDFLAETIAVAGAVQAFYAPPDLGGDGGWHSFPFARDAERAVANPVVPAAEAARGFLHAYLLTNTSPTLAVGAYGLAAGRAAARDSAMLAAVSLLVELGP